MSIIITGGTGLIGRALVKNLTQTGHQVIVLTRNPSTAATLPPGARAVAWDAATSAGWGHLANGAEAIINLAGESIGPSRWSDERKRRIRESRLRAGAAVVQAVRTAENKPGVVIQASAVGYYGPHGAELVTEGAPSGADFLSSVCRDWEASTQEVETANVRRVLLRTGIVLSPEGGVLPLFLLPFRFFVGGPLGSGNQWLPWIHMADEVGAIRFLMETPAASGAFNLCSPNPQTMKDFTATIGKVLGRPSYLPAPSFALKLALGEVSTLVLDGQRQVPQRLLEAGYRFHYSESKAALQDLLKSS
jgi:uncharacterized protein (TIGR01777 family)